MARGVGPDGQIKRTEESPANQVDSRIKRTAESRGWPNHEDHRIKRTDESRGWTNQEDGRTERIAELRGPPNQEDSPKRVRWEPRIQTPLDLERMAYD